MNYINISNNSRHQAKNCTMYIYITYGQSGNLKHFLKIKIIYIYT